MLVNIIFDELGRLFGFRSSCRAINDAYDWESELSVPAAVSSLVGSGNVTTILPEQRPLLHK
jgi:hypothetical protein